MQRPRFVHMAALGDAFRTARESQGLTLEDVAERIHIRSVYLEAIEAEDWNAIGPPVYVRGFMRSYARALGLDPEATVARLSGKAAGGTPAPEVVFAPAPRGEPSASGGSRGESPAKRGLSIGALAGVLVACALVVFVGYEYVEYRRGDPAAPVTAGRALATAAPAVQPPRVNRELERLTPVPSAGSRASGFVIRLRDSSWLRVVLDGKVMMEGLYPKGTTRAFAGRSATVRVGNAGGVDIAVDGKDLGPMGGLGDVAERSYQL